MSGALMTFDRGPKSSGLGLIVELLANALTGGCLPGDSDNQNWGNLAFAIDPDLLVGRESFLKNVESDDGTYQSLKRSDPARDTHPRRPSGLPVTSQRLSGLITTIVITHLDTRTIITGELNELPADPYPQARDFARNPFRLRV